MIWVENLSKNYGQRKAIESLNFRVKKGEVVGFLGPNGAGKTTTMKIITGFMAPSYGEVRVGGISIFEDPIGAKKKIGYLPETPPLYLDMNVRSYLKFVAQLKGVPSSDLAKNINYAIKKTGLETVSSRLIQRLSKGFRQRVGLAQALLSLPEVLILDEPTVGLDPRQVAEVRELIKELKGEHTILLSTHVLSEVEASCDRVIIINEGQIVAEDSLKALSQRGDVSSFYSNEIESLPDEEAPSAEVSQVIEKIVRVEVSRLSALPQLKDLDFVVFVESHKKNELTIKVRLSDSELEKLSKAIVELDMGLLSMQILNPGLEDIFIQLTHSEKRGY